MIFRKRLPCGEVEKARKAIRTFFLLRSLSLSLQGVKETCLPLSNPDSFVQAGDVLDLNNSDLLAVTVVLKDGTRQRRFLVVDLMQIILIEPDSHRLGWGVAKFSGFLQDLEVCRLIFTRGLFLAPTGARLKKSQSLSLRPVLVCLELTIIIFWAVPGLSHICKLS